MTERQAPTVGRRMRVQDWWGKLLLKTPPSSHPVCWLHHTQKLHLESSKHFA